MDLQTTYIWHDKCTIHKEPIYNLRRGQIFDVQIDVQIPKAQIDLQIDLQFAFTNAQGGNKYLMYKLMYK